MLGLPFVNDAEAHRLFKRINTHHDGKITEEEFVAWWNSNTRDSFKKKFGERFIKNDPSQDEAQTANSSGSPPPPTS